MTYALGIDVGTTYTAAATVTAGRAEVAALGHSSLTVPSIVYVREDRSTLVGQTTARRAASDPEGLARDFKRRMGDPVPLLLRGTPFAPEQLTGSLLSWVVETVVGQKGAEPDSVALTHPANWTEFQTSLLRGATQIAGLGDASLVTEPEAAAIAYATTRTVDAGSTIAVYDLGGGTFDASVLRRRDDARFELVGTPQGIDRLGGIDFDLVVMGWVQRQLGDEWASVDRKDPAFPQAMHTLRTECVAAKEELSTDNETNVAVLLPGVQRELRLTRVEFEDMIRPSINLTAETLVRAISSAEIPPDEIESVLLVGGSSRIPLVAEVVAAAVGRPTVTDAHPKFAVALGAALWAANETEGRTRIPGDPMVRELSIPTQVPTTPPSVRSAAGPDETAAGLAPPVAPPPSTSPAEGGSDRRRLVAIIGAVVALVAVAAVVFGLLQGGDDDSTAEPPATTAPAPTTEVDVTAVAPLDTTEPAPVDTATPTTVAPTVAPTTTVPLSLASWSDALLVAVADVEGRPVNAEALTAEGVDAPEEFSPGGLVAWSAALVGGEVTDDAAELYSDMSAAGLLAPVADVDLSAAPGVVLFRAGSGDSVAFPGLGITLGDGRVLVADVADGAVTITDDASRFDFAGVPPSIGSAADVPSGPAAVVVTASRTVGRGAGLAIVDSTLIVGGGSGPGVVTAVTGSVPMEETGSVTVSTTAEPLLGDVIGFDGRAYISVAADAVVARLESSPDGLISSPISVPRGTGDLAAAGDRLFASAVTGVVAIDTGTLGSSVLVDIPDSSLADVHVAFGSVWATDLARGTVRRLDPVSGAQVDELAVGSFPVGIIDTAGLLWVTVADDNRVLGIDPDSLQIVRSIDVGARPWGFAVSGDRLWVSNLGDGTVSLIDVPSGTEVARLAVGPEPDGIAAMGDIAWVLSNDGVVTRLQAIPARA